MSTKTKEEQEADFLDCVKRTRKIYVGQAVFDELKGSGMPLPDGSVFLSKGVIMVLLKYAERSGVYAFEDFVLNPPPAKFDLGVDLGLCRRRRHP